MRVRVGVALGVAVLAGAGQALGQSAATRRPVSPAEVEAWLEAAPGAAGVTEAAEPADEILPRAPRRRGLTIESAVGALGHLGPLRNVSPTSPWFHLQIGFEPWSFLQIFAETDLVFSSTRFARQPPPPRTYRLYGFGGGVRTTVAASESFGVFLQGSAGLARVSEDVLEAYGYRAAKELRPYVGGRVGVEWYAPNPHLAVSLSAGLASYAAGLSRERNEDGALCWTSGLSLRYTF